MAGSQRRDRSLNDTVDACARVGAHVAFI